MTRIDCKQIKDFVDVEHTGKEFRFRIITRRGTLFPPASIGSVYMGRKDPSIMKLREIQVCDCAIARLYRTYFFDGAGI